MSNNELEKKLENALVDYIKSRKFVDTGKLIKSIDFKVSENDIKLTAEPYIQYLDNGKLLEKFFNLDTTQEILIQYIIEKVEDVVDNIDL